MEAMDVAVEAFFIRLAVREEHGLKHHTLTNTAMSTTTPTNTPIVICVFLGTSNGE